MNKSTLFFILFFYIYNLPGQLSKHHMAYQIIEKTESLKKAQHGKIENVAGLV
jgi:hypothetical protein